MFQASYKGFVRIHSFNPKSNSMGLVLLLSTPLDSWWNWGTNKLDYLSEVTQLLLEDREGFDPKNFTFDYGTYGFLGSSDFGNKTLIVGDTETPVDRSEPGEVLFHWKGGFQLRGRNGPRRHPREQMVVVSGNTQPSHRCTSLWMRFLSAESHVPVCAEVSVGSSQPLWRAGALRAAADSVVGWRLWINRASPTPVAKQSEHNVF